ncbi:MAG: methyltransferase domain-containing protein [Kiloniellales bacterium]|nr:methyltransferase domain-containing protein [Kiloniellales bacterium]
MLDCLDAAKARAAATYNAAADHFDEPPLAFWDRIGDRTVERLAPALGDRVLDVGCGAGASALPAARAVGPEGRVIGVDLAEALLERARIKAARLGLGNAEFRYGDMTDLGFPDASFDAVVCVFALFFAPDMEAQIARLWRLVRPGGRLAVTTWGTEAFEPGSRTFWDAVRFFRPDLVNDFRPWTRITEPEAVTRLFLEGGAAAPEVTAEAGVQPLSKVEDWWTIALGSGFRATIDLLSAEEARKVREANLARLRLEGVAGIETGAVYAVARKPV